MNLPTDPQTLEYECKEKAGESLDDTVGSLAEPEVTMNPDSPLMKSLEIPEIPEIPTLELPKVTELPTLELPKVPKLPTIPQIPKVPKLPKGPWRGGTRRKALQSRKFKNRK